MRTIAPWVLCLLVPLTPLIFGCEPVLVVRPDPVPSSATLKPADCALYVKELEIRAQQPPPNPLMDAASAPPVPNEAPEHECQRRLVGKARRVIVRCWHDALTGADVRSCNDRF